MKKINLLLIFALISMLCIFFYIEKPKNVKSTSTQNEPIRSDISYKKRSQKIPTDFLASSPKKEQSTTSNLHVNNLSDNQSVLKENTLRSIQISGNDPESVRIKNQYEMAEYDPSYDLTWQSDIEVSAYNLIASKKEFSHLFVDSYLCSENTCTLKLINNQQELGHIAIIYKLINNLKDTPAIYKSAMTRDVYLDENSYIDGRTITRVTIRTN